MDTKNFKQLGEIGERIAIGELSKFGIDIMLPMSDNLPFDFVIFRDNKFYKCQVKTSDTVSKYNSIRFSITSNNWNKGTTYKYTKEDFDILICCDLKTIYLFKFSDISGKSNIYIRKEATKNGQSKGIIFAKDCIISEDRLSYIFAS